nr:LOW QUALITY PROTEIN: fibroblast growth factor 22 [Loxodonta africana]
MPHAAPARRPAPAPAPAPPRCLPGFPTVSAPRRAFRKRRPRMAGLDGGGEAPERLRKTTATAASTPHLADGKNRGVLEIRSVRVGVVVIKTVYAGFYVAMNRRGQLYGSRVYTGDCGFQERIEENGYNTYAALRWHHRGRPMFLALDRRGAPRRGSRTRRHHLSTHFLPVLVS